MNARPRSNWYLTPILFSCLGCTGQLDIHKGVFEKVAMQNAPADLFVPRALWNKIDGLTKAEHEASTEGSAEGGGHEGGASKGGHEGGGEKAATPGAEDSGTVSFVPIQVFLLEETPGSLHGRNVQLMFGKGGGNLDLAEYIDADAKSDFIFAVEIPGLAEASRVHVYFLNNGKPRKLNGDVYGQSCNTVLDLTTFFKRVIANKGHRVTTLRKLYMNMMVGSYIIAFQTEERWNITQLTISDTRFPDLVCRKEMDASGA